MKRIIEGKRYDTETATPVASNRYSNPGDFNHWSEDLYLTSNGNWFIDGAGGPMSKYSRSTGQNEWSGGRRIVPITAEEAKEWLEEAEAWTALEAHFSDQIIDA